MPKSEHTPGPWAVLDSEHGGTTKWIMDDRGRDLIAEVSVWDGSEAESAANARLIAAAPELLAALQRLHNCVPLSVLGQPESRIVTSAAYWRGAFDEARAALAKAKGVEMFLNRLPRVQPEPTDRADDLILEDEVVVQHKP